MRLDGQTQARVRVRAGCWGGLLGRAAGYEAWLCWLLWLCRGCAVAVLWLCCGCAVAVLWLCLPWLCCGCCDCCDGCDFFGCIVWAAVAVLAA